MSTCCILSVQVQFGTGLVLCGHDGDSDLKGTPVAGEMTAKREAGVLLDGEQLSGKQQPGPRSYRVLSDEAEPQSSQNTSRKRRFPLSLLVIPADQPPTDDSDIEVNLRRHTVSSSSVCSTQHPFKRQMLGLCNAGLLE
jgi:hypothetical protein